MILRTRSVGWGNPPLGLRPGLGRNAPRGEFRVKKVRDSPYKLSGT